MATLDDKILGEKLHYYCSSSEDEDDNDTDKNQPAGNNQQPTFIPESDVPEWERSSSNTGPKGVIKDFQRYKQLEAEKRNESEAEKILLMKKLSLTCSSQKDDEKSRQKDAELDKELDDIMKDEYIKEYMQKRMKEMLDKSHQLPTFGKLFSLLSGSEFLDAIDNEPKDLTIVVHLYENSTSACLTMNGCIQCLAQDYPHVKFCKLSASAAGVTKHFKHNGIPALLIYKGGNLIGNFIRLTDEFGEEFYACDVEGFLLEHGMLPDKELVPKLIRDSEHATTVLQDDSSSDLELE